MRVSELQDAALMLEIEELRLTINDVLALLRPKNRPFTLKHKNQLTSLAKMLKSEEEKESK